MTSPVTRTAIASIAEIRPRVLAAAAATEKAADEKVIEAETPAEAADEKIIEAEKPAEAAADEETVKE